MKDLKNIRSFIQDRVREPLTLCTLVAKSGSSYRDLGAKKVVSAKDAIGFLSGGCLEASIEKAARERRSELPFIASFSTLADEDRLLGYQTGCQGVIDILFEDAHAYPLDLLIPFGAEKIYAGVEVDLSPAKLGFRKAVHSRPSKTSGQLSAIFFEPWLTPPQVFIIGCGADADVYNPIAEAMGWPIQFIDYRQSLITEGRFGKACAHVLPIAGIGAHIPEGPNVAVVLMTHNFEADLEILLSLKDHRIGYLGCLGPAIRFARLKTDLKKFHDAEISPELDAVSFAPAGISTLGKSPEEIALSVCAQIHQQIIEAPRAKTWTLILAAGASRRFGSPKALARIADISFLDHALQVSHEISDKNVLLVTGAYADLIEADALTHQAQFDGWQDGMGASIAFGVSRILELEAKVEQIVIFPVDQPQVSADHLRKLISLTKRSGVCSLTADAESFGPPACLPANQFAHALKLTGEPGLKSVLKPGEFLTVMNAKAFNDVDRPEELALLDQP